MEIKHNLKSKYIIVSYPRSGSNYFQLAWKEKNKEHIRCIRTSKSISDYEIDSDTRVIALIRNPVDAVSSRLLITQTHENVFGTEEEIVEFAVSEYIKIYEFIVERANFIVDLSEFGKIDKILHFISGLETNPVDELAITNRLNNIDNYSPSFADHVDYDQLKEFVKNQDIRACEELYKIAYSNRLMV